MMIPRFLGNWVGWNGKLQPDVLSNHSLWEIPKKDDSVWSFTFDLTKVWHVSQCMHIYVYAIYTHTYEYMCIYIYIWISEYIYIWISEYIYIYICENHPFWCVSVIIRSYPAAGEGSGSWAGGFDLSHDFVTGSLGKGFHSWLRGWWSRAPGSSGSGIPFFWCWLSIWYW